MGIEIERKFLTAGEGWRSFVERSQTIVQCYHFYPNERGVVHFEASKNKVFVTIRGKQNGSSPIELKGATEFKLKQLDEIRHLLNKKMMKVGSTARYLVRFRLVGDEIFVTVKGKQNGCSRVEFESPTDISKEDFRHILTFCGNKVKKIRHHIQHQDDSELLWEVDEFLDDNLMLILAEIELKSEAHIFSKPSWVGDEVTQIDKYNNASLARLPYLIWPRNPE